MVALPQTYNTADLPDSGGGMVLIPQGQYQAVIVESELKPTSKGDGQFLAMKVVITQGQHQNTEFIERLNIINPNPIAVEIAYKTLARISEALGMSQTPTDSNQLHNRPLMIQIETEAGKPYTDNNGEQREGKDKSIIKKYLPMPAAGATPFGAGVPAQGGQAPAAAPFAPPTTEAQPAATTEAADPATQATAAPVNNPFATPQEG